MISATESPESPNGAQAVLKRCRMCGGDFPATVAFWANAGRGGVRHRKCPAYRAGQAAVARANWQKPGRVSLTLNHVLFEEASAASGLSDAKALLEAGLHALLREHGVDFEARQAAQKVGVLLADLSAEQRAAVLRVLEATP